MSGLKHRFFIALLPPQELQLEIHRLKHYFSDHYETKGALRSPPHITLYPPFLWDEGSISDLQKSLESFAMTKSTFSVNLLGFGSFPPRVIYIHVQQTQALAEIHAQLRDHLETTLTITDPSSRPFTPHITLAFRDLSRQHFKAAWADYQHRSFEASFTTTSLTLLIHTGDRWILHSQFPFRYGEEDPKDVPSFSSYSCVTEK